MQDFDKKFPGFEHDTHGVENIKGEYMMYCIKEAMNDERRNCSTQRNQA